jgi:acyl transferase domain-containing protein
VHGNVLLHLNFFILLYCFLLLRQRYSTLVESAFDGEFALFALQYALAKMWQKWGVEPSVCVGYGAGEYAAACVAGVLSLRDAISILQARRKIISNEIGLVSFNPTCEGHCFFLL